MLVTSALRNPERLVARSAMSSLSHSVGDTIVRFITAVQKPHGGKRPVSTPSSVLGHYGLKSHPLPPTPEILARNQSADRSLPSREAVYALFRRVIWSVTIGIRQRTASQTQQKPFRLPNRILSDLSSILPLSSHVAFCILPICPTLHSIASAATKQRFGASWPDPVCSRCLGPPQTTKKKAPRGKRLVGRASKKICTSVLMNVS